MKHIILIDPIEKLIIQKDSTLLFAKSLQYSGKDVYFLFPDNFCISTIDYSLELSLPKFKETEDQLSEITFEKVHLDISPSDVIHMRLEPPFDSNYLRVLWMLKFVQSKGIRIINDPSGIMNYQEKIFPMEKKGATPSAVIRNFKQYQKFIENFENQKNFILKPMDLFQGFGVTKINSESFSEIEFSHLCKSFGGLLIVQPFLDAIEKGEIRSTFFAGKEIGSILKIPPKNSFLANIAQGASYQKIELESSTRKECENMANFLNKAGVPWVAFDLLDGKISEANTTCPGLLYETSKAHGENLAEKIIELI